MRGRTGESCEFWGWPRVAYFPPEFSMRVLRFIMLVVCWGQKHRFRPRCTGRAPPEWSPKRETPVLASRALATDPFPRLFQARPARKLRLTDPECSCAATEISPTRLKPPKMAVFVTISPQSAFLRISLCQPVGLDLKHRLRANIGCETWLVPSIAFCPEGIFWGLETGTYGHCSVRAGALDAQTPKSARKTRNGLVVKHPGRFRPRFGSFRSPWRCCYGHARPKCAKWPKKCPFLSLVHPLYMYMYAHDSTASRQLSEVH